MSKNRVIQQVEREQLESLGKKLPAFGPGDTVVVHVKIKEGDRERLQAFEGVVIGKRNRGLNSSFTVRKVSHGVGVERTFQSYSPLVDSVDLKRRGDVRQAKLYYLRGLTGRAARIAEKLGRRGIEAEQVVEAGPEAESAAPESESAAPEAENAGTAQEGDAPAPGGAAVPAAPDEAAPSGTA